MRDAVQRTWLPTLLFCSLALVWDLTSMPNASTPRGIVTGTTLLLVPPVWWFVVRTRPSLSVLRGIMAGVLCGVVIVVAPIIVVTIASPRWGLVDHSGDSAVAMGILFFGGATIVMASIGAIIGAVGALVERALRHSPKGIS